LNTNRERTSAYYTDKIICSEIFSVLPKIENRTHIKVLEHSVGAGVFLPFIAEKYKDKKCLELWINDIDRDALNCLDCF
jgi:DNA (cytosine-5)-methyltransferase 1